MLRSINRQLIHTSLLVPVAFVIQYIAELEIARRIGPAEFGAFSLMSGAVATSVVVMLLGIPLSFPSLQGDDRRRIGHGVGIVTVLTVVGTATIFLVWSLWQGGPAAAAGVALGFAGSSLWLVRRYLGVAAEKLLPGVFGPRELAVFPIVLAVGALYGVSSGAAVYLLYAAVLLLSESVVLRLVKKRTYEDVVFAMGDRDENRFVIARGLGFLKNSLGNLAFTRADVVLVAFVLGGDQLGNYALASRLALIGTLPIRILEVRFSPTIARRFAESGYAGARAELRSALPVSVGMSFGLLLPVVVAAALLLNGVFPEFDSVRDPVLVLLGGHLIASALTPFGTMLSMTGHHHLRGNITLAFAALLVPLLIAGAAAGDVLGAAVAVSAVVVAMRLVTAVCSVRFS